MSDHLGDADEEIGGDLAEHEPDRVHGRHEELLEGPLLALADDGDRRQDRRHHHQDDRDEPGDDVVGRSPVGVEEDDGLDGEAPLRGGRAGPGDGVGEVLRGEPVHRGERLRAHRRVRPVDEHEHLRRLTAPPEIVVVRRDHQPDARAPRRDLGPRVERVGGHRLDLEGVGRAQLVHELAAVRGLILIDDDRRQVRAPSDR